jgi:hypothetical protein
MHLCRNGQQHLALLRFQRAFLESIFGEKWFRKPHPKHPAYLRWQLLGTYIDRESLIEGGTNVDEITDLGRTMLDSFLLATLGGGDIATRDPGDLRTYGGPDMQTFIKKRLPEAEFFEDVMCELSFAGWHRTLGRTVHPDQRDGMPDLRIDLPEPLLVDCKRLTSTSLNSLKNHLRKANKQVAAYNALHGTCYPGIAAVDISAVVRVGRSAGDEIPRAVTEFEENVRNLLHGPYSSLSAVVLLWDDLLVTQDGEKTWYAFRRRYRQVNHQKPKHPVTDDRLFGQVEARNSILWWKPLGKPLEIWKTDDFDELANALQLSPEMVAQTYFHPDRADVLFHNADLQRRVVLLLKNFPTANPPSTLVLCSDEKRAGEDSPNRATLQFAFPLLSAGAQLGTPRQVLAEVVKRYGLEFQFRGDHYRIMDGIEVPGPVAGVANELRTALKQSGFWFFAGLDADEQRLDTPVLVSLALSVNLAEYSKWKSAP